MFRWRYLDKELKRFLSQGLLTVDQLEEVREQLKEAALREERALVKSTLLNSLYLVLMGGGIGIFLMQSYMHSEQFMTLVGLTFVLMVAPLLAFPLMKGWTRELLIGRVQKQYNDALSKGYSVDIVERYKL